MAYALQQTGWGDRVDAGLVSSLSGTLAQAKRVEKIANNLANADTVGFKADHLIFEEALQGAHIPDERSDLPERPYTDTELLSRAGDERRVALFGAEFTDLRAGQFRATQNPLDIAIEGNGFLEVLTPDGIRLTRAGSLTLDAAGRLVNRDGFLILGAGAPGANPETRAIVLGSQSLVQIDADGQIYSSQANGGTPLGRLALVQVENPAALKKQAGQLFEALPDAGLRPVGAPVAQAPAAAAGERAPASTADFVRPNPLGPANVPPKIHQGMVEGSNVNPLSEMTSLIEAQRLFDQNTKLMQVHGDTSSRVSEVGRF